MLIGFHGTMGVGKSEACKALARLALVDGKSLYVVKFAQPLYDIQEFIYDRIRTVHTRPADFIKDRKLLQWLGTDWGRNTISESVWVDVWKAEVQKLLALGHVVVCDDVRFDNEAKIIKKLKGKVVRIISDRAAARIDTGAGIKNHASEAGITAALVDITLENNSTISEFQEGLETLYKLYRKKARAKKVTGRKTKSKRKGSK